MTATKSHPKVLVAMSAFKGRLSNSEASAVVASALKEIAFDVYVQPVGDGGLGTAAAVFQARGGEWREYHVPGPLGEITTAKALFNPSVKSAQWIYIEAPQAIGHQLVPAEKRDALRASSRGLGVWLGQIIKSHPTTPLFVGLGDSATSDMGMGMLEAMGMKFRDRSGRELAADANALRLIENWDFSPSFPKTFPPITVLCDVLNPLCGPKGSAKTFAPQKGATPSQVTLIEQGMDHFANLIQKNLGKEIRSLPMTGSAGGISAALQSFLGAQFVQGARYLLDWIGFDEMLSRSNFLIVGEGKTDDQTLSGKSPYECLKRANEQKVKSILISGLLGPNIESLSQQMHAQLFQCGDQPDAAEALRQKTIEVFKGL
jgi:glycerate 2-kinase